MDGHAARPPSTLAAAFGFAVAFVALFTAGPIRVAAAPAAFPAAASAAAEGDALAPQRWVVGSKRFTESYILGELVRQTLAAQGIEAEHRAGLGNTGVLEQALAAGAVDVVPEYTGTIAREWLHLRGEPALAELNAALAPRGLVAAVPLGFNDSYALAMSEPAAAALGVRTVS
jgi:osmoprotectant transport system permease protein